jgi:hypothetical protein
MLQILKLCSTIKMEFFRKKIFLLNFNFASIILFQSAQHLYGIRIRTNGSGSRRPKHLRIIRIRNTARNVKSSLLKNRITHGV